MRDPVSHGAESFVDKVVAPLSAMPLLRHETGTKQDAEVLGDGWAAHLELSRNRVDGTVGLNKEIEHPATRRMANCPKDILLAIGSHDHGFAQNSKSKTRNPKQIRSTKKETSKQVLAEPALSDFGFRHSCFGFWAKPTIMLQPSC
jgi:hypothetical protein